LNLGEVGTDSFPLTARDVIIDLSNEDFDDKASTPSYKYDSDDAMSESRMEDLLNGNIDNYSLISPQTIIATEQSSNNEDIEALNKNEECVLTEEQENHILMFCELTGSDTEYAKTILEVK
jgi:hypothetical protein